MQGNLSGITPEHPYTRLWNSTKSGSPSINRFQYHSVMNEGTLQREKKEVPLASTINQIFSTHHQHLPLKKWLDANPDQTMCTPHEITNITKVCWLTHHSKKETASLIATHRHYLNTPQWTARRESRKRSFTELSKEAKGSLLTEDPKLHIIIPRWPGSETQGLKNKIQYNDVR